MKRYLRIFLPVSLFLFVLCVLISSQNVSAKSKKSSSSELEEAVSLHSTIYNGQDYSHVYDYDYYTTKIHPELAGKSDKTVLKYFVENGIPNRERGNRLFSCRWYYNSHPELRYKYRRNWRKYYLYYQKKGYTEGKVARTTKLKNPIDYYIKDGMEISLSSIYDFKYYTKHNSSAYKFWVNRDDAGAIRHFVKYGMKHYLKAKKGIGAYTKRYQKLSNQIYPEGITDTDKKARQYTSETNYLILLNLTEHKVSIYKDYEKGANGNWRLLKRFSCTVGSPAHPTPTGVYKIGAKGRYFVSGSTVKCWWFSQINGSILFHSVLYSLADEPVRVVDGRLGVSVSHGCVRLAIENAKYINAHIPHDTKVVIYT